MKKKQNPLELFFPSIADGHENEEVAKIHKEVTRLFGFTPRFYRVLAASPDLVKGYWEGYKNIMLKGKLSRDIKEMLFLSIAVNEDCAYCSSIHLAICDMLEVNSDLLHYLILDIDGIPEQNLRELVRFVIKALHEPDAMTLDEFDILEKLNFTKIEILEAIAVANYSMSCINMAKNTMISVDKEVQEYLNRKATLSGLIRIK